MILSGAKPPAPLPFVCLSTDVRFHIDVQYWRHPAHSEIQTICECRWPLNLGAAVGASGRGINQQLALLGTALPPLCLLAASLVRQVQIGQIERDGRGRAAQPCLESLCFIMLRLAIRAHSNAAFA